MKKFIFTTILTLMGVMALTSCIEKRGEQLTTMLTIESSQDLIDACDIEITYKGKGGVNMVDTITTAKWHKIIINDSFPTKVGMVNLRYLVKPGFKPTKDTYNLECEYKITFKEQYQDWGGYWPLKMPDVPGEKVVSFLELKNFQGKDVVDNPNIHNGNVSVVTKSEYDPNGMFPFVFDYEWQTDDSTMVQLVEEKPVENPDFDKKEASEAADNK